MGRFYRIIFLFASLIPFRSVGQAIDCEQTIAYATEEFNEGHFYAVPGILSECLNSLNRDQRQRAHLLLVQTYLLLDDPIGAERSFMEVLAANPEFVADEQLHSIDVVYLSKRFTATPRFSWFVTGGTNVSPVRVIHDNEMTRGVEGEQVEKSYSLRLGYTLGVGAEYSYDDHFRFRMEAKFDQTRYHLHVTGLFDGDSRTFTDRQTWITVPAYLSYTSNTGKYRPYGYAGYAFSYMLGDKGSMTKDNVTSEEAGAGEGPRRNILATSPDVSLLYRRNRFNHSIIVGGGIKYKVGLDFVFAEVRYMAGLKNIVRASADISDQVDLWDQSNGLRDSRHVATQLQLAYGHRDDYLRLDNVAITIGFLRPLYKPRELKRARTKSVLKKMTQD